MSSQVGLPCAARHLYTGTDKNWSRTVSMVTSGGREPADETSVHWYRQNWSMTVSMVTSGGREPDDETSQAAGGSTGLQVHVSNVHQAEEWGIRLGLIKGQGLWAMSVACRT